MLKLKVDTEDNGVIEYNIPNGWDEINIREYQFIMNIDDNISKIEGYVSIIKMLSGMDDDTIDEIPGDDFELIVKTLAFTSLELAVPEKIPEFIELKGEKFYLKKDFESFDVGEQRSIDIITTKYDGRLEKALPELLCIFLRKKKDNGKLEKFKRSFMDRTESFKEIIILDIHQLIIFFSTGNKS